MRLRATHSVTVYAEQTVDTTDLGTDLTENTKPVLQAPVRFTDESRQFVRSPQGEHEEQMPRMWLPPYGTDPETDEQVVSANRVEPGMDVKLVGNDGWTSNPDDRFSIEEITINRRRGSRPERVECELQYHE